MLEALRLEAAELSVLLCDDAIMRDLNRRHRGIETATDVLAFASTEGVARGSARGLRGPRSAWDSCGEVPGIPLVLGDVVISLTTAKRHAADRGLAGAVTRLLAHGLLHLLGFDHRTPDQDRRMRAKVDLLYATARPRGRLPVPAARQAGRTRSRK